MDRLFKLTNRQMAFLEVLTNLPDSCAGELHVTALWVLFRQKLNAMGIQVGPGRNAIASSMQAVTKSLKRRGFVRDRHRGNKHLWSLGPLSDHLKETGVLKM